MHPWNILNCNWNIEWKPSKLWSSVKKHFFLAIPSNTLPFTYTQNVIHKKPTRLYLHSIGNVGKFISPKHSISNYLNIEKNGYERIWTAQIGPLCSVQKVSSRLAWRVHLGLSGTTLSNCMDLFLII